MRFPLKRGYEVRLLLKRGHEARFPLKRGHEARFPLKRGYEVRRRTMESYAIERPEDMLTVAGMMKKDDERKRVENFAVVWRVQERQNPDIGRATGGRLEIGHSAILYGLIHGKIRYLGEVRLSSARAWAKEMAENG